MSAKKMPEGYTGFVQGVDKASVLHSQGRLGDMCRCGHFRTEHRGNVLGGECMVKGCKCKQFTWYCWLVKKE